MYLLYCTFLFLELWIWSLHVLICTSKRLRSRNKVQHSTWITYLYWMYCYCSIVTVWSGFFLDGVASPELKICILFCHLHCISGAVSKLLKIIVPFFYPWLAWPFSILQNDDIMRFFSGWQHHGSWCYQPEKISWYRNIIIL